MDDFAKLAVVFIVCLSAVAGVGYLSDAYTTAQAIKAGYVQTESNVRGRPIWTKPARCEKCKASLTAEQPQE